MDDSIKVSYLTRYGWRSTAYLDNEESDSTRFGQDKYSDDDIHVKWDEAAEEWIEIGE